MKKLLVVTMWGAWIGFSLAIVGFPFMTWQFWFVLVPTVALISIRDYYLYEK